MTQKIGFIVILVFFALVGLLSALDWTDCPLNSRYEAENPNVRAQCTKVPVPLSGDSDAQINIFVKRFVYEKHVEARSDPIALKHSLLAIPGIVPADTMNVVEDTLSTLVTKDLGSTDAFTFDIRGTGLSERIGCHLSQAEAPGSEGGERIVPSEMEACVEEFAGRSKYFTADHIARDVLRIAAALKNSNLLPGDLYLYGHSFSSFIAQRVIQIHETEAQKIGNLKGLILDSVFNVADDEKQNLQRFTLNRVNANYNKVGLEFIAKVCGGSDFCASKFYDPVTYKRINPAKYLEDTISEIYKDESECHRFKSEVSQDELRSLFGWLLSSFERREIIPAVIFRLERCNEVGNGDVLTILHLVEEWRKGMEKINVSQFSSSPILMRHLLFNEFISENGTETADENTQYFGAHFIDELMEESSSWPKYDRSPYFNQSFTISANYDVLILSGEQDPLSPREQSQALFNSIKAQERGDARSILVDFPQVSNYVLANSIKKNDGDSCGISIVRQFMNGDKDLDVTCSRELLRKPKFVGDAKLNEELLGTDDAWEGMYSKPGPTVNLFLFLGIQSATSITFIVLLLAAVYVIIIQKLKLRRFTKSPLKIDEEYESLIQ